MDYYDEYDRDLMEYENELYKDPAEESEDEDEIDSEIEDKLLSAIHYSSDLIGNKQQKTSVSQNNKSESSSNTNSSLNSGKKINENNNYKNKPQKPSIINSANVIPAPIYNEAKTNSISKTDLSNIYNMDSDDNSDDNNDIDSDGYNNLKKMNDDSDDSEINSKIGLSKISSLNNKKLNSNINQNKNSDDNKNEIFEDFTNQSVTNIKSEESGNVQGETTDNESEDYLTHVILPSTFDDEKSTTTTLTNTTENFDEDIDNKKGTTRYFAPQAKKEVICYFCRQAGHLSVDCDQKKTLCPICKDNHDPLKCPYSNACLKCACIGHQSRDCPNLWQRQECRFCNDYHSTVECPFLWRRYNLNINASKYKSKSIVRRYCYNCGLEGHFGDECEERRYNKVFKVSAQSIKNEDPEPITSEELEEWHFNKEKQKNYNLKNKNSYNNYKHNYNHNSNSNRSRKNSNNYNDNYNNDYNYKKNHNRKRSRNQDYDDSDDYSDYSYKKHDYKSNKFNRSGERNNDKFNHNNIKSKNNRNNNYNNSNYDNKFKKRKSNYNFSSTKPSIRSRLS